jgi:hypothetical protein
LINTYEEYLSQEKTLTMEQMQKLHADMVQEIGSDTDAGELYQDMVEEATKYAKMRADWLLMSREQKAEQDSLRTSYHNKTIIQLNMLARYLKMQGKPAAWRESLGNEKEDGFCRKTIGDFACYLVFVNSINAR